MAYEAAAHALIADLYADATRRQRVVTCNIDTGGDTCAQTVLSAFARRAWRRPVTAEEIQSLMKPVTAARTVAATPTEGIRHALAAVLLSPFFIFKVEIDADPTSTASRRVFAARAGDPHVVRALVVDAGRHLVGGGGQRPARDR